jgi:hypothetical protein
MTSTTPNPESNGGARTRWRRAVAGGAIAACALYLASGCATTSAHRYRSFQSALDRGASCSELFDQRARFDEGMQARIDNDLERIGCRSPADTRSDR